MPSNKNNQQPFTPVTAKNRQTHSSKSTTLTPHVSGDVRDTHQKYPNSDRNVNVRPVVKHRKIKTEQPQVKVNLGAPVPNPPIVTRADSGSELSALFKRADKIPIPAVEGGFVRGFYLLLQKFDQFPVIEVDEGFLRDWMDKLRPAKKAAMEAALKEPIAPKGMHDKTVITKLEVHNKAPGSSPRVVYDGTDRSNLVMGAVTNELSKRMSMVLSLSNPRNMGHKFVYASGMNSKEIAETVTQFNGHYVEADFKSNDALQSPGMRKYEAMFYKKLGAPMWYCAEVAKCTDWTVFTPHGMTVEIYGQRLSGECPTATGNTFVNICIKLAGLSQTGSPESFSIILGDDELTIVQVPVLCTVPAVEILQPVVEAYQASAEESGMQVEIALPKPHMATFLRKRFYAPNGNHEAAVPVPMMGRLTERLPMRANLNATVSDRDYMAGKFMSAAYEVRYFDRLRDLLLDTSSWLSNSPYFNPRNPSAGMFENRAAILNEIAKAQANTLNPSLANDAIESIYGVTYDDLICHFIEVIQGVLTVNLTPDELIEANVPPIFYRDSSVRTRLMEVDVPDQAQVLPT